MKETAGIPQIYKTRSSTYLPWIQMGEFIMTQDGPLTQGERELLATYVSSLNECRFCRAGHLPSMQLHGIEQEVVDALVRDIDTAPVEDRLKPIFDFARKLTLAPATLTQADADRVYAAGWDEDALHLAILVTCRFSFMNRLVMGFGLNPPDTDQAMVNAKLRHEHGYGQTHEKITNTAVDEKHAKAGTLR